MPASHGEVYDIHRGFSETPFAEKLAAEVRYNKYRPDHISKDEWVDILGADVGNLSHMPLTYGIARAFVHHARENQPELLTTEEEKLLLIAAITHDWAEAIITDISLGDKTETHEAEEQAAFEKNLAAFYQGPDFDLVDTARREVVFDHQSKVGRMLNAVERIGYVRTALRAHDILVSGVEDDALRAGLTWLVFDVVSNIEPHRYPEGTASLLQYRDLAPVDAYLISVQDTIGAMFEYSMQHVEEVLPKYGSKADQKREQMLYSVRNWYLSKSPVVLT